MRRFFKGPGTPPSSQSGYRTWSLSSSSSVWMVICASSSPRRCWEDQRRFYGEIASRQQSTEVTLPLRGLRCERPCGRSMFCGFTPHRSLWIGWMPSMFCGKRTVGEYIEEFEDFHMRCRKEEDPQLLIAMFARGLSEEYCAVILTQNPAAIDEAYHIVEGSAYARRHAPGTTRTSSAPNRLAAPMRTTPTNGWNRGATANPKDLQTPASSSDRPATTAARPAYPAARPTATAPAPTQNATIQCFTCGGRGHRASVCPTTPVGVVVTDEDYTPDALVEEVDEYHGECDDDGDDEPIMGFMQIVASPSPPSPAPVEEVDEYHGECEDDGDSEPFMGFVHIVASPLPPSPAPVEEVDEYRGECEDDGDIEPFMGFMQIVASPPPPSPNQQDRPMMSVGLDSPAPEAPASVPHCTQAITAVITTEKAPPTAQMPTARAPESTPTAVPRTTSARRPLRDPRIRPRCLRHSSDRNRFLLSRRPPRVPSAPEFSISSSA